IGIANYIEVASGWPRERAEITVHAEGRVDVAIGTLSAGQGHETTFAQLIAEWLGVELPQVRLITGDADLVPVGGGSHSGRSMRLGGVVLAKAADQLVAQGRRIAAWRLEAAAAARRADAPEALRGPLAGACDETLPVPSFPY